MKSPAVPWPEDEPVVPLWPDAAHVWGMGRSRAYYLANRDEFPCPVFRVGAMWMVLTVELRRALGLPTERPETRPRSRQRAS